jgi:hypothetical protein
MTNKLVQAQATVTQLIHAGLGGDDHNLFPLLSPHAAQLRTISPLSRPLGGTEKGQAPPSTPALTRTGTPAQSAGVTEPTNYTRLSKKIFHRSS